MPEAPLCFILKGEFFMEKEENIGWIITDPDCLQCCRPTPDLGPNVFELTQINSFYGHVDGKPFYQVAHGHVYLDDYSKEEELEALAMYGYDRLERHSDGLPELSDDEYNQLLAEMYFETEIQEFCCYEFGTWNEALEKIQQLTGLDLTDFREVPKPSLDQQINDAKQKSVSQVGREHMPATLGR